MSAHPLLAECLRLFAAFLLAAAVSGKLRGLAEFGQNLEESFGLPASASRLAASAIVGAEALLAVLILAGPVAWGMAGALLLFGVFTAVLSYKFFREGIVKCGCFGEAQRSVSGYDLVRNLLTLAAIGAFLSLPETGAGLEPPARLLAAALALWLSVVVVKFHDLCMLLLHAADGPI